MQKTLGGDRLGSGKRMRVNMHGYDRSTHDMGTIFRTTMAAGTLVPFLKQIALPGDTFDINLDVDVKTHPTIGPLFGSYKVQLDLFQIPLRLYNSLMHNNMLGIGNDMSKVKLPIIELNAKTPTETTTDYDNYQINQSTLLAYLGIRGVGRTETNNTPRTFNAVPILAYWDIYKNYYANKQEQKGYVIHISPPAINETVDEVTVSIELPAGTTDVILPQTTPGAATPGWNETTTIKIDYTGARPDPNSITLLTNSGWETLASLGDIVNEVTGSYTIQYKRFTGKYAYAWDYINSAPPQQTKPRLQDFLLKNIDDMRILILRWASTTTPYDINDDPIAPYRYLNEDQNGIANMVSSQEGLGIKTYQSDLFNNWLDTEWIDSINDISSISTVGNSFTVEQLILGKKVYDYLNRIAVSGGSYDDWQDATWAHERYKRAETPIYEGGLIRELVFQEVVNNSGSEDQPLGTLAGKGIMSGKRKGGKIVIKIDEPGYIMGIVSLTPRIDYSQGNDWDVHLQTMDDLHKPALDQIGFQDLITEQMAWWDTEFTGGNWVTKSAGKQPAWINYMTNINKNYGNFAYADNEMFMTLNRRYERDEDTGDIKDLTTYIDPSKFNFIFAETTLDAQNFWVQIGVDITARRKMSAKIMPNL